MNEGDDTPIEENNSGWLKLKRAGEVVNRLQPNFEGKRYKSVK